MSLPRDQKQRTLERLLGAQMRDWRPLAQNGVIVRLVIGRCRFTTSLNLEDLGMQQMDLRVQQAMRKTVVLGAKRLIPESYLSRLARTENQARRLLMAHAFLLHVGSTTVYFVPSTAYKKWKTGIEDFERQYFALRDEIIAKHSDIVEQMLDEYRIVAEQTYQRMKEFQPGWQEEKEQFVTGYCERIRALIPTPQRILESFRFDVFLSNPLQILEIDLGSATDVSSNSTKAQQMMRDDLRQQVQKREKETIDTFLTTILAQLRTSIALVLSDVLASIQRQKRARFPKSALNTLKRLIRQIESLQFYDDQQLSSFLEELKMIIRQPTEQRDLALPQIQETLASIVAAARVTLLDLGIEEQRSAREENPLSEITIPPAPGRQEREPLRGELPKVVNQKRQVRNQEDIVDWDNTPPSGKWSRTARSL